MGIPSYFAHILKKYPRIIKSLHQLLVIDNLYMDCNGIIYEVVRQMTYDSDSCADFEKELIENVCKSINNCIEMVNPINRVFIAFDGVAPVAKLNQQRERRFKSWYLSHMESEKRKMMIKEGIKVNAPKACWNTTAITPGTNFMTELHKMLHEKYKNMDNVIVSSSKEPGEGEHKIFEYLRKFEKEHSKQTTLIYGMDADLIMLCLSHLNISEKIYLYRETPEYLKSINVKLDVNEKYYVDIPEFANEIAKQLTKLELSVNEKHTKVLDYIFMCFMLGNDFMPHFPMLNIRTTGISTLMETYCATFKLKEGIIQACENGLKINWLQYKKFVQNLALQELTLIRKEHNTRDRQSRYMRDNEDPENVMHDVMMLPMIEREVEMYINPFKNGWEKRYYSELCAVSNVDSLNELCRNYLEGMEWTFKYYTTGCVDWTWSYNNHYPPLLKDLETHIPEETIDLLKVKPKDPISEMVQLCYVLPEQSYSLLPCNVSRCLKKIVSSKEPTFKWAYCKFFWECHTDLPKLNINEIITVISKIK
jgi:5'-3' exonuclease